jgi:four helix bundle protein
VIRDSGFVKSPDRQPRPHERLEVWRDAMSLVEEVYRVSRGFPPEERYGLQAQVRRAAVSVPSNIAEGAARHSRAELLRFLAIARGSLSELDTQLQIAIRLGFHSQGKSVDELIDRTFAKLNALITSLQGRPQAAFSNHESQMTNHNAHAD